MSQPKVLSEAIGGSLRSVGFKKKKTDSWYLESTDTIAVLNLQKSAYAQQYYINIGVWLKALGAAEAPAEHKCHIRCRWESLIPQDESKLERLLNAEDTSISDEQRIMQIGAMVQTYVLPFFSAAESLDALREAYHGQSWPKGVLVHVNAQKLLGQRPVGP